MSVETLFRWDREEDRNENLNDMNKNIIITMLLLLAAMIANAQEQNKAPLVVLDGKPINLNENGKPDNIIRKNVRGEKVKKVIDFDLLTDKTMAQLIDTEAENIKSLTFLANPAHAAVWGELGKNGVFEVKTKNPIKVPLKADEHEVFIETFLNPQFPGGDKAYVDYIKKNMRYPEEAKKKGIEGRVLVQCIVEKDGSHNSYKVIKSVDPLLDEEAIRIVKGMPKLIPAKERNELRRVRYTMPITFRLEKEGDKHRNE